MSLAHLLYERHLDGAEVERRLVLGLLEQQTIDLAELTDAVLDLHPEKANWLTLLNRLWLASVAGGAEAAHRELAARAVELSAERLEGTATLLEVLGPRRVILTLSSSSFVIAALAAGAGRRRVVMGESRPLREGVTAARDLAAVGVEVTVVADSVLLGLPLTAAELPAPLRFDREEAVVLFGADALLADGFIAKSGARALAEIAGLAGLPVIVAAEACRLVPAALASRFTPPAADPVDLGAPAAVHPVHLPVELVPWRLVTTVVVGAEAVPPAAIAGRVAPLPVAPELARRWRARF